MQFVSFLLSLLLVLQLTHWPLAALAADVSFTPGAGAGQGALQAEIPVNKIGKLLLTDATAVIKGNTVDVIGIPANTTEKKNVLSGVVVKTDVSGSGKHGKITGLVYFRSGPSLSAIDDPTAEEYIDLNDGGVVSGHIVAINHDEVEIEDRNGRRRKFAMVDVKTIRSPKVFAFAIPITAAAAISLGTAVSGTAPKMTFTGTATGKVAAAAKVQTTTTSGGKQPSTQTSTGTTGGMSTAMKVVIGVAVAAGIATAIAVPVAIGVASAGNSTSPNQRIQAANFQKLYLEQLTKTGPFAPPPPPPVSSGP